MWFDGLFWGIFDSDGFVQQPVAQIILMKVCSYLNTFRGRDEFHRIVDLYCMNYLRHGKLRQAKGKIHRESMRGFISTLF